MNLYIYLQGGLGNQMFQYAAGLSALKEYSQFTDLKLDTSFYDNQKRKVIVNGLTGRGYDLDILNIKYNQIETCPEGATMIQGWFQNINEFLNVIDEVRDQFTFGIKFSENIQRLREEIISSKNSVCIHVRRGDYIHNPTAYAYHGYMDKDYYLEAMKIMEEFYGDVNYYIFSEDTDWCKENISNKKYKVTFVGDQYSGDRDSGNFYLMQSCENHIIANSTFSWWSAFLGKSKLTIGPKNWCKDGTGSEIMLDNWIKI
jgi:hypothetical protein